MNNCRVYWGSHGCDLERGHKGTHICNCCDCPDEDPLNSNCVAHEPYYGPDTVFYGEDT